MTFGNGKPSIGAAVVWSVGDMDGGAMVAVHGDAIAVIEPVRA